MNKPATVSAAASIASAKHHSQQPDKMTEQEAEELYVKKWLINALCIYPIMSKALISQTMQGCKAKTDSAAWQTILEVLVAEGYVYKYRKQTTTVSGRQQYLTLYRLTAHASIFIVLHLPNQDPHTATRIHMANAPEASADPAALLKAISEIPDLSPYIDASDEELNALDPDVNDNIKDLQMRHVQQTSTDDTGVDTGYDDDEVSPDFWDDED